MSTLLIFDCFSRYFFFGAENCEQSPSFLSFNLGPFISLAELLNTLFLAKSSLSSSLCSSCQREQNMPWGLKPLLCTSKWKVASAAFMIEMTRRAPPLHSSHHVECDGAVCWFRFQDFVPGTDQLPGVQGPSDVAIRQQDQTFRGIFRINHWSAVCNSYARYWKRGCAQPRCCLAIIGQETKRRV